MLHATTTMLHDNHAARLIHWIRMQDLLSKGRANGSLVKVHALIN